MITPGQRLARRGETRPLLSPEGVVLEFELAAMGERALALTLDVVLQLLCLLLLGVALAFSPWAGTQVATAVILLFFFLVRTGYFMFFELRWHGSTPGKRWQKLRVMNRHGGTLESTAVITRNLTREIEVFGPILLLLIPNLVTDAGSATSSYLAGGWLLTFGLMPFLNKDRLRVGDLIAGTMVVVEPKVTLLADIALKATPTAHPSPPDHTFTREQLAIYGIYELQVLEDVLRAEGPEHRDTRAMVAKKICDKISYPGPVDPLPFLRAFYKAQRAHLETELVLGRRRERKRS